MSETGDQPQGQSEEYVDPDADPGNLSPRDDRGGEGEHYDDPDADPEMLNPREG